MPRHAGESAGSNAGARRRALAPLLAVAASAVAAQEAAPAPPTWSVSAGVVHRRLVERTEGGQRLVTETGELLRLRAAGEHLLAGGGALSAEASIAAGRLDYRGQTQTGIPLQTHDAHRDLALGLSWRPLAPARWGEAWLLLRGLQQRRQIASVSFARGLRETSVLLLPGVRWRHGFEAAGWQWVPSVEASVSARHRLEVDSGGLFDTADIRGGMRRELVLGLEAGPPASAWRFGLEWAHARQSASPSQSIFRAGSVAGTVRQPRIELHDVTLRATRVF